MSAAEPMAAPTWRWDDSQQAVLDACVPGARISVVGAAGSGKTALVKACAQQILQHNPQASVAVLSPDRRAAGELRNELAVLLGGLNERVAVKSISAFAFDIVAAYAQKMGRRAPELISGPDQDVMLKEIFALASEGLLPDIDNAALNTFGVTMAAAQLPAFRAEMRDLITRAAELGLRPATLAELGERYQRPVWKFGARLMQRYESALATQASAQSTNPDRVDHARLLTQASAILREWDRADLADSGLGRLNITRPHWDALIVDDVQNATLALRTLLAALAADGSMIITFGNPDQAVQGFRGGIAQLPKLLTYAPQAGGIGATKYVLQQIYRANSRLGHVAKAVAERIHASAGSEQRKAQYGQSADGSSEGKASNLSASVEPDKRRDALSDERSANRTAQSDAPAANHKATDRASNASQAAPAVSARAINVNTESVWAGSARAVSLPNDSEELAYVANELRRWHLLGHVPYSQMVVITRSHSAHGGLRAELIRHGVPVEAAPSALPLREQPAVAALLAVIHLALEAGESGTKRAESDEAAGEANFAGDPGAMGDARAADAANAGVVSSAINDADQLVTSVLGSRLLGIDPLAIRLMRRRLRAAAAMQGVVLNERDVWVYFAQHAEAEFFTSEPALLPLIKALRAAQQAHAAAAPASSVLWQVWNQLDVAEQWRAQALGIGVEADQANSDLDAVIALFRVAQRLEDQDARAATIERLLAHLEAQDLPEDTVAVSGSSRDAVTLATSATTIGRSWQHVIVMGLNDGVWPNTRLRNPIAHVPELVSIVVGSVLAGRDIEPSQLRAEVVDDELRMLYQAVSRAQQSVTLTCVASAEVLPSCFVEWLSTGGNPVLKLAHHASSVAVLGLPALIGELRQALSYGNPEIRQSAAHILAQLAAGGISAADPHKWADQMKITSGADANSASPQSSSALITVTPVTASGMLACPLKAFFESVGGRDEDDTHYLDLGNLIHEIAQNHGPGELSAMEAELAQRWPELAGYTQGYFSQTEYRAAQKMVRNLAAYLDQAPAGVLVEQQAAAQLDKYRVSARLDRVEYDPAQPCAVQVADFKTGKTAPSAAQVAVHPQLLIYQWLVDQGALAEFEKAESVQARSEGARLIYLRQGSPRKLAVKTQARADKQALATAQRMIRAAGALNAGEEFLSRPEFSRCKECAFAVMCPAQGAERIFS